MPTAVAQVETLTLPNGTVVTDGDVVKVKGEHGKEFIFRGVRIPEGHRPYVNAYGGDKKPEGARQWRAFDIDRVTTRVRTNAQRLGGRA